MRDKKQNLLNVSAFIFIGDRNILTTGYQINSTTLSKFLIINGKIRFNNALNIIIPAEVSWTQ